ncbi:MAG: class I SAM-dependent methyltransferase [bacterium]
MLTVDFDLLDVRPGVNFLDAGCGGGRHAFEALRRGAEVMAMDYDAEECKRVVYSFTAAENDGKAPGRWNMVRGDVLCLPFSENSFDRVICAEVCEHLHEDLRVLASIYRIMKPGGRIAVTVPTTFSELAYRWIEPFYFENPGGHVRIFTPKEMEKKLTRTGFHIYAVRHSHGFHTPYWLLRCIFGLEKADHPVTRRYHKFLEKAMLSYFMAGVEKRVLNYICPKSIIFYAWKPKG